MREKVLVQWLKGISRDEIANNVEIGAGSVSEIIAEYRKNNSDFDLQREYVVNIKKKGRNLDQLGSAIRLANRLDKLHLNPGQIETFLDKNDEHCFKKGTETVVFIKNVADVCSLSSKTKTPVEGLPSRIKDMKAEISSLSMEILLKKVEREKALHIHNITEMQLREFAMNRPVIEGLQTAEAALAYVTMERDAAFMEICRLRDRLDFGEYAIALRKMNDSKDDKSRS